jgi:hypothetical protein
LKQHEVPQESPARNNIDEEGKREREK